MISIRTFRRLLVTLGTLTAIAANASGQDDPFVAQATGELKFTVMYDASICDSYTGRVYIMLAPGAARREPRFGPNWFNPQPMFAVDVEDWKPETALTIDRTAVWFPHPMSELRGGDYMVQAAIRLNPDSPQIAGAGNAYSKSGKYTILGAQSPEVKLRISQVASKRPFRETDRVKLVEIKSALLSAFYGRDVYQRAAVVLPIGYNDHPELKYPTLYVIPGFGGTHEGAYRYGREGVSHTERQLCRVILDPSCGLGHHVFADSANNGPRGQALIDELIPAIEQRFRLVADPNARYLTGGSSGGWSSLWLQVAYPDYFGGVWSFAPDPVDFHDFQRINLYDQGVNMYVDQQGDRRPLARRGANTIAIFYEDFAKMEWIAGDGGQLSSFEAVFSERGEDGQPRRVFDRQSGDVNSAVAQSWKKYDIGLKLQREWKTIGPKLAGKINVHMGSIDTFYLEGATIRLKKTLEDLGSDAVVEIHEGKNHGNVASREVRVRIETEMMEVFVNHFGAHALPPELDDEP